MIARDEDALICDMAEYYHIYEMRELPVRKLAVLAFGLPPESRSRIAQSGAEVSPQLLLLSLIADHLSTFVWLHTEDGANGTNRPKSLVDTICYPRAESKEKETDVQTFSSGEEFEAARKQIVGG